MNDYQTKLEELQKIQHEAGIMCDETYTAWRKAVLLYHESIDDILDFKRKNRGKYERPSNS